MGYPNSKRVIQRLLIFSCWAGLCFRTGWEAPRFICATCQPQGFYRSGTRTTSSTVTPFVAVLLAQPCWQHSGLGLGRHGDRSWALQSSLQASLPQRGPPHPLPDAQQQFAALCSWENTRTRDTSARRVWITGHCQWGGKKRAINLEIYSVILP